MTHKYHGKNHDLYLDTLVTKTLYVDGNRTDSYTENGSITKPFKTITAALNAASADDTILVLPGTYTEAITLKHDVSIIGLSRDKTLITSSGNTITVPTGIRSLIEHLQIHSSGASAKTINMDGATGGYLRIHDVWVFAQPGGYPIYIKDSANFWGRHVDTEGGQVYIENSSGINIDKMLFHGDDPITVLYIKNCTTSEAVTIRDGAILGIEAVTGNKAVVVENSKVTFAENRIQSALEDGLTISDGAGSSTVKIAMSEILINNPTKKSVIVEASSSLEIGANTGYDSACDCCAHI